MYRRTLKLVMNYSKGNNDEIYLLNQDASLTNYIMREYEILPVNHA
jgi:hypothetical protein